MAQATLSIIRSSPLAPEEIRHRFTELEGDIGDVVAMSEIAFQQVNAMVEDIEFENGEPVGTGELSGRTVDCALFGARHLLQMIRALQTKYYEAGR